MDNKNSNKNQMNNPKNTGTGGSVYASKKRQERGKRMPAAGRDKQEEFDQRIVDIARVTRVMAGGKRMRFRACVAIGDKKGRVAIGLAKGADVTLAVTKDVNKAKKNFIEVPMVSETIPHELRYKYGAAKILLKPARPGKGVIAGGAARIIFELAGIKNITSKILGTNNKVNIVKCAIRALDSLKKVEKPKKQEIKKEAEKSDGNKDAEVKKKEEMSGK